MTDFNWETRDFNQSAPSITYLYQKFPMPKKPKDWIELFEGIYKERMKETDGAFLPNRLFYHPIINHEWHGMTDDSPKQLIKNRIIYTIRTRINVRTEFIEDSDLTELVGETPIIWMSEWFIQTSSDRPAVVIDFSKEG